MSVKAAETRDHELTHLNQVQVTVHGLDPTSFSVSFLVETWTSYDPRMQLIDRQRMVSSYYKKSQISGML